MQYLKYLLATTALIFSVASLAEVKLIVPEHVDVLSVNMQKPKLDGKLFSSEKSIALPDGENQIVFQYQPAFEVDENLRRAYGEIIIAKFDQSNTELTFKLPEYRNYREAEKSVHDLDWSLNNPQGQQVEVASDILKSEGVQIGRNYSEEAEEYNRKGGPAAVAVSYMVVSNQVHAAAPVAATVSAPAAAPASVEKVAVPQTAGSENVSQLQYWYSKASAEERKTFRRWMIDQE